MEVPQRILCGRKVLRGDARSAGKTRPMGEFRWGVTGHGRIRREYQSRGATGILHPRKSGRRHQGERFFRTIRISTRGLKDRCACKLRLGITEKLLDQHSGMDESLEFPFFSDAADAGMMLSHELERIKTGHLGADVRHGMEKAEEWTWRDGHFCGLIIGEPIMSTSRFANGNDDFPGSFAEGDALISGSIFVDSRDLIKRNADTFHIRRDVFENAVHQLVLNGGQDSLLVSLSEEIVEAVLVVVSPERDLRDPARLLETSGQLNERPGHGEEEPVTDSKPEETPVEEGEGSTVVKGFGK